MLGQWISFFIENAGKIKINLRYFQNRLHCDDDIIMKFIRDLCKILKKKKKKKKSINAL